MELNRKVLQKVIAVFLLFCSISILLPVERVKIAQASSPTDDYYLYLPLILKNFKTPPLPTVSRYLGYNDGYVHDLTWSKLYTLGCNQGASTPSNFVGYVVLNFGEPWHDGSTYGTRLFDSPHYTFISTSDIETLSKAFLQGYWDCSPNDSRLILAIGTNNDGPFVEYGHGEAWAGLINNIADWIESPPSYASQEGVVGAIDSELDWNMADVSLDWRNGYISWATRFYLYFGDCAGCPTAQLPGWLPNNAWTVEDVYQMSGGTNYNLPLPQIYSKDRANAQQWQYLSLYAYINHYEPLSFMGSMTQWHACQERDNCNSGTPNAID